MKNNSIGAIEFRSIAKGIEVSNELIKTSNVAISYFKSICPGKFLMIVNGDESDVNQAIAYGLTLGEKFIVDSFVLHRVHPEIIQAFKHKYTIPESIGAIGIMETNKVCAGLRALDKTLKTSNVSLVKLQIAFGIGGKCVYIIAGELSSLEYGLREAKATLNEKDIVYTTVIPSTDLDVIQQLIH